MNILFVSCLLPYSQVAHGGGVDLFHLIESLSARHEVHLVSIAAEPELPYVPDIQTYCASVRVVTPSWSWRQKLRQAWRGLWTRPLLIGRRARAEMRAFIRQTISEAAIDVAQFEWTETAAYVDAVPPGRTVRILDEVDVSYRPAEYRARHLTHPLLRPCALWRSRQVKCGELDLCRRFDAILTRSEHDRQVLNAEVPELVVHVLHPWTHLAELADVREDERQRGRLVFVGAMDRDENCEAALFFYQRVFPRVRQAWPQAEFWVAGANPPARIMALARDPAVKVTGYVDSLRPIYAACDVFVAPMLLPGGVFNKIVDAMAAGRPVVTTTVGNEGIAAREGEAILIADDPADFAGSVVRLLGDDSLWRRVASNGRGHVQQTYDWRANIRRLESLYEQLLAQRNDVK